MEKLTLKMGTKKLTLTNGIETGLNIIAQDILWKHTEKDIDNFINRFKLDEKK